MAQTQISLELTNLLGLPRSIDKAAQSFLGMVRRFTDSGSDILVEEDLTIVFGRARISRTISSSFRELVARPGVVHRISSMIVLDSDAGPTITRALSDKGGPYFSTVIQLSMLASIHSPEDLCNCIFNVFETLQEVTGDQAAVSIPLPPVDRIRDVINACEDQTSGYTWIEHLHGIAATFGNFHMPLYSTLHRCVLRGLAISLPYVQSLPEDRLVVVRAESGLEMMILWTHILLELDVLVELKGGQRKVFGQEPASVIIEYGMNTGSTVTVCEAKSGDTLLTLVPDEEEEPMSPLIKVKACGYGIHALRDCWDRGFGSVCADDPYFRACFLDMMHTSIAMALRISDNLAKSANIQYLTEDELELSYNQIPSSVSQEDSSQHVSHMVQRRYLINSGKILRVAEMLFDNRSISRSSIDKWSQHIDHLSCNDFQLMTIFQLRDITEYHVRLGFRLYLEPALFSLATVMVALAHCTNASEIHEMVLNRGLSVLSKLVLRFEGLKTNSMTPINPRVLFGVITTLMGNISEPVSLISKPVSMIREPVSMISGGGWTAYFATYGDYDPANLDNGFFCIKRGIPSRKGVKRRYVYDTPTSETLSNSDVQAFFSPNRVSLKTHFTSRFDTPICGHHHDGFILCIRIFQRLSEGFQSVNHVSRRTSYGEMLDASRNVAVVIACKHGPVDVDTSYCLGVGQAATLVAYDDDFENISERVVICLTAGNVAARWAALIAIKRHRERNCEDFRIILRGPECCARCAIEEALLTDAEKVYVVL